MEPRGSLAEQYATRTLDAVLAGLSVPGAGGDPSAVAAGIGEPAETVASRRLTVRQAVTVTAAAGAAVAAAAGTVIVIGLRRAHRAA